MNALVAMRKNDIAIPHSLTAIRVDYARKINKIWLINSLIVLIKNQMTRFSKCKISAVDVNTSKKKKKVTCT